MIPIEPVNLELSIKTDKFATTSSLVTTTSLPPDTIVANLRSSIALILSERSDYNLEEKDVRLYVDNRELNNEWSFEENGVISGDTIFAAFENHPPQPNHSPFCSTTNVNPFLPAASKSFNDLPIIPETPACYRDTTHGEEPCRANTMEGLLKVPKYVELDDLLKHKNFTKEMRAFCKARGRIHFADVFLYALEGKKKCSRIIYTLACLLFLCGVTFGYLLWATLFAEVQVNWRMKESLRELEIVAGMDWSIPTWWSFGSSDEGLGISEYQEEIINSNQFGNWLRNIYAAEQLTDFVVYGKISGEYVINDNEWSTTEFTVFDERLETYQWVSLNSCAQGSSFSEEVSTHCELWDHATFRLYQILCGPFIKQNCVILSADDTNVESTREGVFCDTADNCAGGSFHEDSIVWVENTNAITGSIPTPMKDVRAGDRVLSMSSDNRTFFDIVWFNLHGSLPKSTRVFPLVELEVITGDDVLTLLSVTPDHILFSSAAETKPARKFVIGDSIFTSLGLAAVTRIRSLSPRSVRSLLTMTGRYVVGPLSYQHNVLPNQFGVVADNLVEGIAPTLTKLPFLTKLAMKLEAFRELRREPPSPYIDHIIQVIVDSYVYITLRWPSIGLLIGPVVLPLMDLSVLSLMLASGLCKLDLFLILLLSMVGLLYSCPNVVYLFSR